MTRSDGGKDAADGSLTGASPVGYELSFDSVSLFVAELLSIGGVLSSSFKPFKCGLNALGNGN